MKVIKVIKFTPLVVGALLLCQCSNEEQIQNSNRRASRKHPKYNVSPPKWTKKRKTTATSRKKVFAPTSKNSSK